MSREILDAQLKKKRKKERKRGKQFAVTVINHRRRASREKSLLPGGIYIYTRIKLAETERNAAAEKIQFGKFSCEDFSSQ